MTWIKVEDKLPERRDDHMKSFSIEVEVFEETTKMQYMSYYDYHYKCWHLNKPVTHWKYKTKPPEE